MSKAHKEYVRSHRGFVCADTGETFLNYKEYPKYLQSRHWAETRKKKIEEQNGVCEICHKKIKPKSDIAIHHLTYKHIGNEPLSDLQCLCSSCHNEIHGAKKKANVENVSKRRDKMYNLMLRQLKKLSMKQQKEIVVMLVKKYELHQA